MNISMILFTVSLAMMQSSVTLIGEQIGKSNIMLAKKYYETHFLICGVLIMILCVV